MRFKPIVFSSFYVYQLHEEDENDKWVCTILKQTTKNRSRNEVEPYSTSPPLDYDDAVDWGDRMVTALSK